MPRKLGVQYLLVGCGLFSSQAMAAPPTQLDLATTFGSLLLVLAFIFFLAFMLKRMKVPSLINQKDLSIVRQIAVGTKERIAVVQAGEEQFLVGITSQSIQLISKLDTPIKQEELEKSQFANQLSQLLTKNEKK